MILGKVDTSNLILIKHVFLLCFLHELLIFYIFFNFIYTSEDDKLVAFIIIHKCSF